MGSVRYLWIHAMQGPFGLGLDATGRRVRAFNVIAEKEPGDTLLEDLAQVLVDAGLGTLASTIFLGEGAVLPTGNGPYFVIVDTGGVAPTRLLPTATGVTWDRPTARIAVHAADPAAARTAARAAFDALALTNTTIVTA